jgi:vitamin B12 transporter
VKSGIESRLVGAAMLALILAVDTHAQEIDEIIVTEELEETVPLDLSRYGNQVEVVTAEQIQAHGFADISQTLQMLVPGLHVSPKNGPFDYVTASLQGSRREDILWLVDGVRITNRLYNGTSPLDTIPAHMVERIEILKGGQGIFYGTQSVGGVINIVTRSLSGDSGGAVGFGVHTNDGYNVHGNVRGGNDTHQFAIFASKDDSDGYQPWRDDALQPSSTDLDRGYDVLSAGVKYAWNASDDTSLSAQLIKTDADLDFARPYLNKQTVNSREEEILTAKLNHRFNDSAELYVKAYRHTWDTRYTRIYNELDDNGDLTGGEVVRNDQSYWGYEDYGFNAMAKLNFGGNVEYIVGLDQQNFSGEDDVWRIGKQRERVTAPFVQLRTTDELFETTMLAVGARHNSASNMEGSTVWNVSGKHNFSDRLYLQGNIGTSFRMPDAEALFLNEYYDDDDDGIPDGGWFAIGNPKLEPEESLNINVSLGGAWSRGAWEATYFQRDITNYIDSYVPTTIGGVVGETFVNSDDEANISGFEFVVRTEFTDSISAELSYTATDAKFNDSGPQLRGIPEDEAKLLLSYRRPDSQIGFSLAADFVGDVNDREPRGDYVVADIATSYNLGDQDEHQIVLRLENMFDEEYATSVGVGTVDATGDSYLYDNLGMERTLHLNYTYGF